MAREVGGASAIEGAHRPSLFTAANFICQNIYVRQLPYFFDKNYIGCFIYGAGVASEAALKATQWDIVVEAVGLVDYRLEYLLEVERSRRARYRRIFLSQERVRRDAS